MANLWELRDQLSDSFSMEELNTLSFDLGIDFEDIEGGSKTLKAQGLVAYCDRRDRLPDLLRRCEVLRPRGNWRAFAASGFTVDAVGTTITASPLSPEQIRLFMEVLGPGLNLERIRNNLFVQTQFEAYHDIWKSLLELDTAGDDLWQEASGENILRFAQILDSTGTMVEENAIFLEEQDYRELRELLETFGRYRLGKIRLYEIRHAEDLENVSESYAHQQIEENSAHKQDYEQLLEKIRTSFRRRLQPAASQL